MAEQLQGSLDYLKDKSKEFLEKPTEEIIDTSYKEVLKLVAKFVGVGIFYLLLAVTGNEVFDISKASGIVFIFGLLILMTVLYGFWRKQKIEFTLFRSNHQTEMLCLAQSSVHAVDIVSNDMRKEMSVMKDELIDTFKATIDAYQNQVNHLIFEVLNEKRKIQNYYQVNNNDKKKKRKRSP